MLGASGLVWEISVSSSYGWEVVLRIRRLFSPIVVFAFNHTQNGLAIFGLSILAILAAEFVTKGAFWLNDAVRDSSAQEASPVYEKPTFDPAQLDHETRRAENDKDYQPYTLWTTGPFQGNLVNIDRYGDRVTHFNSSRPGALQVWMPGGSTTWGAGAPDDQTIPSYLAKLFNETWKVDTQVRNLGEMAFVSTQELFRLQRELQADGRPGVVVFYDGVNDSVTAELWPEVLGSHYRLTASAGSEGSRGLPMPSSQKSPKGPLWGKQEQLHGNHQPRQDSHC